MWSFFSTLQTSLPPVIQNWSPMTTPLVILCDLLRDPLPPLWSFVIFWWPPSPPKRITWFLNGPLSMQLHRLFIKFMQFYWSKSQSQLELNASQKSSRIWIIPLDGNIGDIKMVLITLVLLFYRTIIIPWATYCQICPLFFNYCWHHSSVCV